MKNLKFLFTLLASLALFATFAAAQTTTPGVTVTASLFDGQGNIQKTSYLHFELWNCGDNVPQLSEGTGAIVASQFDMRANPTTGIISGAIYGSDQIFCATQNSTEWLVTEFKASNAPVANPQYYCLTSGETFNPAVTQPCITSASVPQTLWSVLFGNYTADQTWTQPEGTQANLEGDFLLNGLPLGNPIALETNGEANASQSSLNLIAGANVTLANSGGGVTISTPNVSGTVPQQAPPGNPFVNSTASTSGAYLGGITYVTPSANWTETILSGANNLTAGVAGSITLPAGIVGINVTSGMGYQVLLCGSFYSTGNYAGECSDSTGEAVNVTGGTYSTASGGTILFTPFFSHGQSAAYQVLSASTGIQETLNAACGTNSSFWDNAQCHVIIPANGYSTSAGEGNTFTNYNYYVYGSIFLHTNQSTLEGDGVVLACVGRAGCLQIGVLGVSSTHFQQNKVSGISFRAGVPFSGESSAYAGVNITNTVTAAGVATVTTATAHNYRVGDLVAQMFTDNVDYWGDVIVTSVPSTTTYTHTLAGATTIASQNTPGVTALAYSATLDNGFGTTLENIQSDGNGGAGRFNNFFDFWDDEKAHVTDFNNNSTGLNGSLTWSGSFFFASHSPSFTEALAPVILAENTSITSNNNCATIYNQNGFTAINFTCQGQSLWELYSANSNGNFNGATLDGIYSEGTGNSASPAKSPFPGLGTAGAIFGPATGVSYNSVKGTGSLLGSVPSGTSGSVNAFTYYIVANCSGTGSSVCNPAVQTSPIPVLNWTSSGTGTGSDGAIPDAWARIANNADTITYDGLRCPSTASGNASVSYPYTGGAPGGSVTACGYIFQGLSQATACGNTLVCSYTDSGATATVPHTGTAANYPLLGNYTGLLNFEPAAMVVLGGGNSPGIIVDNEQSPAIGIGLHGNPVQIAHKCAGGGISSPGGYTACASSDTIGNNASRSQTALLLPDGAVNNPAGSDYFSKGRLNLTNVPNLPIDAHHFITLLDSQPGLTQATPGYRPAASVNDVYIGSDNPANSAATAGQLSFGSPVSITNYIAQIGDGIHANWLERLTATLKEFNVAVKFDTYTDYVGMASAPANPASGNCRPYFNTSTGLETFINSSGGSCNPSNGGGVAWSALTSSGGNLSVALSTYTTLFTEGDLGSSPVNGLWETTDAASTTTDTSTDFRSSVPAGSYHEAALFDVDGFSDLAVCNVDGTSHVGEVVVGNFSSAALLPCPLLSTTPLNKFTVINNSNNRTEMALVHSSNTGGGGNIMLRFLTASSNSGLLAFSVCAGTTNLDGSCNGTTVASLNDAGLFTGAFAGNLTGNSSSASNASQLLGSTWANPPAFGTSSQNTGAFLALAATAITGSTSVTSPQFCIGASCITSWPSGAVTSVFTRTGAIVAAVGDYSSFYPQLGTSGSPVNNVFYGNETFNGQITQICLTCANEYTATINTVASTAPGSGFSADGFDTTANGGKFYWCENGNACNYLTTVLAGKLSLTGGTLTGGLILPSLGSSTNCASVASPAVCGSAMAGAVVIAASSTSVVVDTTAVTANSEIHVMSDETLAGRFSATTCNSSAATVGAGLYISARTAGTSFTVTTLGTVSSNPLCLTYIIVN